MYSSLILKHIEAEFGSPLADYFDLICGTSTGGLIALALSRKVPTSKIVQFYEEFGTTLFPPHFRQLRSIRQFLLGSKYSNVKLRACLEELLGATTTMGDANTLLCIPAFSLTNGKPRVFKYPHNEGNFSMDRNILMVDVGLATSSAPAYFPIVEIGNELCCDGGVWCNNPSFCGVVEALKYFVGEKKMFSTFRVLSVGNIERPSGWQPTSWKSRSYMGWQFGLSIIRAAMSGQAFFTDFALSSALLHIEPQGSYFRIPQPEISPGQLKTLGLDLATAKSRKTLVHFGNLQGHECRSKYREDIAPFFVSPKHYITHSNTRTNGELSQLIY